MTKPRHLTEEEKRLWETVTQYDRKRREKRAAPEPEPPPPPENFADLLAQVDGLHAAKPPIKQPPSAYAQPIVQAPAPTKKGATPPLTVMPKREAEKLFKPHARTQSTIDLHGLTQEEAFTALLRFLRARHAAGKRHIAIITGKGRGGEGVLRRAVPHWLELPELRKLVVAITHATPEKGGDGVLHVLLKKP